MYFPLLSSPEENMAYISAHNEAHRQQKKLGFYGVRILDDQFRCRLCCQMLAIDEVPQHMDDHKSRIPYRNTLNPSRRMCLFCKYTCFINKWEQHIQRHVSQTRDTFLPVFRGPDGPIYSYICTECWEYVHFNFSAHSDLCPARNHRAITTIRFGNHPTIGDNGSLRLMDQYLITKIISLIRNPKI
jgi:hypothetical protein